MRQGMLTPEYRISVMKTYLETIINRLVKTPYLRGIAWMFCIFFCITFWVVCIQLGIKAWGLVSKLFMGV